MREMHEFLPTSPFDIYGLHLLHLVARFGSFTRAAQVAGLTQSAITRQIQGIETRLGLPLLERTTRQVKPTAAGEFLLAQTARVLGDIDSCLRRLREEFAEAPKEVRLGVSKTISLAYLPGFVVGHRRAHPSVQLKVSHQHSGEIVQALEENNLDVGVISPPTRLSAALRITHRFKDAFVLITPKEITPPSRVISENPRDWQKWLQQQSWLLIHEESNTGTRLRRWLTRRNWLPRSVAEFDNFDLVINLVAVGMGVSVVPHRALALYSRSRSVQRFQIPDRFTRELAVLVRRAPAPAEHIAHFVERVLF
ncbi:LysR family transcriptional regulator [Verrucomicrobiota bacterium sgz303538]